jgi:HSP20 family protein
MKEEAVTVEGAERTRERRAFSPRADIHETNDAIVVLAEIPGADEKAVDLTLEKNVLTINAYTDAEPHEGMRLVYGEYGLGDYTRSFVLSDKIDREKIEASVKDGVLRLVLTKQKSNESAARRIPIHMS